MTPPKTWSAEYLFHGRNCDAQIAVGPFVCAQDAERLLRETPELRRSGDVLLLGVQTHDYVVAPSSLIVHGELPSSTDQAPDEFAFVGAWIFSTPRLATISPYAREVTRFWLRHPRPTFDRGGLRTSLLHHFREARLSRTQGTEALDVYESCGKRVDALLDELIEEHWFVERPSLESSAIRATTQLLTQWPSLRAESLA